MKEKRGHPVSRDLDGTIVDLVAGNHILHERNIVDAFGHLSARHPNEADAYLLSRSLSPAMVQAGDIQTYNLDSEALKPGPAPYLERFIHGGIYRARPDVNAVLHCHAQALVAFGITGHVLRPATHLSAAMGVEAPCWDIRNKFGDTNLLVTANEQAADLAQALGSATVVLMRGHGATFAGPDIRSVVLTAIHVLLNAEIVLKAVGLGPVTYLSPGEVECCREALLGPNPIKRAWEHYLSLVAD